MTEIEFPFGFLMKFWTINSKINPGGAGNIARTYNDWLNTQAWCAAKKVEIYKKMYAETMWCAWTCVYDVWKCTKLTTNVY